MVLGYGESGFFEPHGFCGEEQNETKFMTFSTVTSLNAY